MKKLSVMATLGLRRLSTVSFVPQVSASHSYCDDESFIRDLIPRINDSEDITKIEKFPIQED